MIQYSKENLKNMIPFELNGTLNLTKAAAKHFANENYERAGTILATISCLIGDFEPEALLDVIADLEAEWKAMATRECEKHGIDWEAFTSQKLADFPKKGKIPNDWGMNQLLTKTQLTSEGETWTYLGQTNEGFLFQSTTEANKKKVFDYAVLHAISQGMSSQWSLIDKL